MSKNKLPIICGGTGFYIQALVDNVVLPEVSPNPILRKKLSKKSSEVLMKMLRKLDPVRAKNIDPKNNRRIIRAIEIATTLGKVPKIKKRISNTQFLQIGIKTPDKLLHKNITIRLFARISRGMIAEAKRLHGQGLSWKRMEELGLEYRYLAYYLQNKMAKSEMARKLDTEIWHYARRQKTWFKRDKRIRWFGLREKNKIEKEVSTFLK